MKLSYVAITDEEIDATGALIWEEIRRFDDVHRYEEFAPSDLDEIPVSRFRLKAVMHLLERCRTKKVEAGTVVRANVNGDNLDGVNGDDDPI